MKALLSRLLGRPDRRRHARPRLGVEALEGRLAPAKFTVTSFIDSGAGSLRTAILAANAHPGADVITFNVGGGGAQTIVLFHALPAVTGPVSLAGNTQPGFAGSPLIDVNGLFTGAGASGLTLAPGAAGSSIRGLVINSFGGSGLLIQASNCSVQGCFLGTNIAGTAAVPNGFGVTIAGASGNVIGGASAAARNIISGNTGAGVLIGGSAARNNLVEGNRIGTNAAGTAVVPNGDGVLIGAGARHNVVGGALAGQGNLISGNTNDGVHLDGAGTTANLVQGNSIGTAGLGNDDGVAIGNGTRANTVLGNVISGNGAGVLVIDPGTSANLLAGNKIGTNAAGSAANGNAVGVIIQAGATGNSVAGNLISGNAFDGLDLGDAGTRGNVVRGNKIGTNAAGTAALSNGFHGVLVYGSASHNVIGGTTAGARNVISGNSGDGILILGAGTTVVQGNDIGTNAAGTAALGNGSGGVNVVGGSHNVIGGTTALARNIISGNSRAGISISDQGSDGNVLEGNYIGTNAAGTAPVGNALHGVVIFDGAHDNQVGGTVPGAGNVIAFNGGAGVLIGSDPAHFLGDAGTGNAVLGNSIFNNAGLGIDLGPFDGVTANDVDDADSGPNNLQNFPVLTRAAAIAGVGTYVAGSLDSGLDQSYRIEFFSDPAPDGSGHGEGRVFLGAITVVIPGNTVSFAALLPVAAASGSAVTATATDAAGNTSEFAFNVNVL
jgi:titin